MAPGAISPPPAAAQLSSPVLKPILKRKRSPDSSQGTQSKKVKVAFDPEVDIKPEHGPPEKDVALIREEMAYTIRHRDSYGSEDYEQLVSYFDLRPGAEGAPSATLLSKHLSGLISNASLLTRSHSDLVQAVLRHQWLAREEMLVNLHIQFLGHLVSSHGGYLSDVLKMLVENFVHLSTSAGYTLSANFPPRPALRSRVHKALKYVLRIIPSASNTLSTILKSSFPYADESRKTHVQFVKNLLRLVEYCPELKTDVFDLITDRLIKLDVEVQIDVEELEDDVGEIIAQKEPFDASTDQPPYEEEEDYDSDDELDEDDVDEDQKRLKALSSTVEKMDALIDILFLTHSSKTSASDKLSRNSTFEILLSQFQKLILRTYRSRHTQFLLFHVAQSSQDFADRFIETCLRTLKSRSDTILRVSAAAYLASFVARGARLAGDTVVRAFMELSTYAESLRRQYEPTCRGPDRRKYDPYYATMQALIYIFCFRWRQLHQRPRRRRSSTLALPTSLEVDDESDDSDPEEDEELPAHDYVWLPGVKEAFWTNVYSKLNPLKVCAPEVVEEFARIAHHLGFMYVYPLLNSNRRIRLQGAASTTDADGNRSNTLGSMPERETSLTHLPGERHLQLDAYFPFDPYGLPISKRWLEGDYNHWQEPPGMNSEAQASAGQLEGRSQFEADPSSGEEDDETSEEEEDIEDQATATPRSDSIGSG